MTYPVHLQFAYQFADVGLTLNGVKHANNSIVTITDIGINSAALNCTTTYFLSDHK